VSKVSPSLAAASLHPRGVHSQSGTHGHIWAMSSLQLQLQVQHVSYMCILKYSIHGSHLFALRTIRTSDYSYYGWTIRTLDDSYDGLFVRWTIRTMDFSYQDYSYYGLFAPSVKYSHNINCWCEKGAHPTGCLSNASRPKRKTSYLCVQLWHVGYFFTYSSSSSCLLFHIF